ncbi:MAG TPA: DNA-directed RNA polymerase subunit omega [Candidatus Borkfalkia excrementipullorum]|nr:DNA-directed RNA polymerase subunit omega [Candidatus Borkfalkia excrementipullorum]
MINEPVVDRLVEKLGTDGHPASRYALCVVVAKRARQIIDQEQNQGLTELPGNVKEIALACQEIMSGKLTMTKD